MNLSQIQVISLELPEDPKWVERTNKAKMYFAEQGIENILWIQGVHAHKWGVTGRHIYLLDGRPEEQFYKGDASVGCYLSMYVIYNVMNVLPHSHFMFLETDCQFVEGWRPKLAQALLDVPEDFDFLFIGSCCAEDKQPVRVKGDVWHFPYRGIEKWDWYPQCGHAYIVAKKAIPTLISTQKDTASPADVSLIRWAFPSLKVYAILPRLADQGSTELPK